MDKAIENLPIVFLLMIAAGVIMIVIGMIRLAGMKIEEEKKTSEGEKTEKDALQLQELFSYFLEEEEKKNDALREMVQIKTKQTHQEVATQPQLTMDQKAFNEIIKRYKQGEDPQSIAKSLKKGIGEVKLIISLYSMR